MTTKKRMDSSTKFTVIGLAGKAGSGKDFITQHVIRPLGYMQFSLAWHFKVGIVGKGLATHEEVFFTKPPEIRRQLQLEGTEYGRNVYGEDVWCNTTLEWFHVLSENWGIRKFIIPDIRFPNEVQFIRALGGAVYRIHAPVRVEQNKLTPEQRQHPSETSLDDYTEFDGRINNDIGISLESLHMQVGLLLEKFERQVT